MVNHVHKAITMIKHGQPWSQAEKRPGETWLTMNDYGHKTKGVSHDHKSNG